LRGAPTLKNWQTRSVSKITWKRPATTTTVALPGIDVLLEAAAQGAAKVGDNNKRKQVGVMVTYAWTRGQVLAMMH